jgi:hypothetical protein
MPRWARMPFLVGMFYLAHLGDGVGQLHQQGVGVAAGEDHVHHLRAPRSASATTAGSSIP